MSLDFNFMTHSEDMVLWKYDYASKCFIHKETGESFPFRFDPDTGVFTTSKGVSFEIIPMSKFTLADFQHEYRMKYEPLPPKHKVQVGDGANDFILETNENDVGWKLAYARYTEQGAMEMLRFMIAYSVQVTIPKDVESRLHRLAKRMGHELGDDNVDELLTYYYVKDSLGADEQEMYAFFDVLLGRSMITKEALKRAEKRFPNGSSGV